MAWKLPSISTHVHPTNFNYGKFAWREPPFTTSIRCQEMFVTVDTAKYTQFYTLQRLCTFTKGPNQPKLSSHFRWWRGKGRRLRQDLSEVLLHPSAGLTHFNLLTSTTTCQAGVSPYNLVDQDIAHMTLGCTNSIFTWRNIGPFVPGWPFTSEIPW